MDQDPELEKKFPSGMGQFVPDPPVNIPGYNQELNRTDRTILSVEEIRSIGRFGIYADSLVEHSDITIIEEDDLPQVEDMLSTLSVNTLINLAGLAIHSPNLTISHDKEPTTGFGLLETLADTRINDLGRTVTHSVENAPNN